MTDFKNTTGKLMAARGKKSILMAVGSSGGHIFPALAVADKLAGLSPLKIYFVHSGSKLGEKTLSQIKYPVYKIPIGGLAKGQSFFRKIKTVGQLPLAFLRAVRLIKKLKAEVVFGTGGSVTGPVLLAGFLMGRKTAIWEGNAIMGLANRRLAPFVSRVFSFFPHLKGAPAAKLSLCGYPLREKSLSEGKSFLSAEAGESRPSKPDRPFKALVLGGSQGSFLINQAVSRALSEGEEWRKGIFIYHQTGEKAFDSIKKKYKNLSGARAFAFSLNIGEYYKNCDVIFSRAGAGAIAEAAFFGKALILIPLAYSAGGHQLKNAERLSFEGRAEMIKESDFSARIFKAKLVQLKQDKKRREKLAQSLKTAFPAGGAGQIARGLLSL